MATTVTLLLAVLATPIVVIFQDDILDCQVITAGMSKLDIVLKEATLTRCIILAGEAWLHDQVSKIRDHLFLENRATLRVCMVDGRDKQISGCAADIPRVVGVKRVGGRDLGSVVQLEVPPKSDSVQITRELRKAKRARHRANRGVRRQKKEAEEEEDAETGLASAEDHRLLDCIVKSMPVRPAKPLTMVPERATNILLPPLPFSLPLSQAGAQLTEEVIEQDKATSSMISLEKTGELLSSSLEAESSSPPSSPPSWHNAFLPEVIQRPTGSLQTRCERDVAQSGSTSAISISLTPPANSLSQRLREIDLDYGEDFDWADDAIEDAITRRGIVAEVVESDAEVARQ